MLFRFVFTLLCLAGSTWYLAGEQRQGKLDFLADKFLNFLVISARDRFEKTAPAGKVALVEIREEDRADYASWPPPPLDWQTLLKGLQPYHPEVLVIVPPLNWGQPSLDFVPAVAEALVPFPSVVLGVETSLVEKTVSSPAFLGDLDARLPRLPRVDGPVSQLPALAALITAPDPAVRGSNELGLVCIRQEDGIWKLPYAVRDGDTAIPTLLAQVFARFNRTPYAQGSRLVVGAAAGAHLLNGIYVPLDDSAQMSISSPTNIPVINALTLMLGDLAGPISDADKATLESASILVVGFGASAAQPCQDTPARLYAQAFQNQLSQPSLHQLSELWQILVWSILAVGIAWLAARLNRRQLLIAGVIGVLGLPLFSILLFQSFLIWFPPVIPLSQILAGTLLALLLPTRKLRQTTPAKDPVPAPGKDEGADTSSAATAAPASAPEAKPPLQK